MKVEIENVLKEARLIKELKDIILPSNPDMPIWIHVQRNDEREVKRYDLAIILRKIAYLERNALVNEIIEGAL